MLSGLQGLKLLLAPLVWRFFETTMNLDTYSNKNHGLQPPYIFVSLHRDLLPSIMYLKPTKVAVVISNSLDGDILVRTLGSEHYHFIRGASGQGGGRAFVGMRKMLESGVSVGIAVDGPEGPFGRIHDGAIHLAKITGCPIVPLKAKPSRAWALKSWDRTVIPWPFFRVQMDVGSPFLVPHDSQDIETYRLLIRDFLLEGQEAS